MSLISHPDLGMMQLDWEVKELGEVAHITKLAGYEFTKHIEYIDSGEIIALRSLNVVDGQLDLSKIKRISKSVSDALPRSKLLKNDLLLTYTGSQLGDTALIDRNDKYHLAPNVCRLRANSDIDAYFLYVFLRSRIFSAILENYKVGTSQPTVPMKNVRKIPLPWPTEAERIEIGKVYQCLNDKIELNCQMNETLELIAQALFKSWFVDFDPVIDNALVAGNPIPDVFAKRAEQRKQLNSEKGSLKPAASPHQSHFPSEFEYTEEMGWIPKGWSVSDVDSEYNTVGGATPSTKNSDFWEDGNIYWTTPKDLSGNQSKVLLETGRKITKLGLKKISSGVLPVDTVLMSSRAPVGYLALAKVPVAINQGYIAIKCEKTLSSEYALLWADSIMDDIKQRAGGTTFAEISKKIFRAIPVVVPDVELVTEYSDIVKDIYNQITYGLRNNDSLTKLRDTLLPKLLSGELRIPDAEKLIEDIQ